MEVGMEKYVEPVIVQEPRTDNELLEILVANQVVTGKNIISIKHSITFIQFVILIGIVISIFSSCANLVF